MKPSLQLTPEFSAALLCAAAAAVLWISLFRPALPGPAAAAPARPELIRLIADDETLDKLKTPTLFALPSEEGFSGKFLESRMDLRLIHEKPASPARYLPNREIPAPGVDTALLNGKSLLPQEALPVPGSAPRTSLPADTATRLFFSPELEVRRSDNHLPGAFLSGVPETVRVNLAIRPDGSVEYALFETPVTNTALLLAVRQMNFKPSEKQTEGWMDIRFVPEGEKNVR